MITRDDEVLSEDVYLALRGMGYHHTMIVRWQNTGPRMGHYTVGDYVDTDDDILLRARNYGPKAHQITVAVRDLLEYSDYVGRRVDGE